MKKKSLLLFCVLCGCLLMTSCYTTKYVSLQQDYNEVYKGKTHNYIVTQNGAPDRQTSDGEGGTILIYEKTTYQSTATAENVNYYTGTYTPGARTTESTDYVHFYINSDGYCYGVKTNHYKQEKEKVTIPEKQKKFIKVMAYATGGLVLADFLLLLVF